MPTHVPGVRARNHFALAVAAVSACVLSGCGGAENSKPAPVDQAQMKKAQEYMGDYRGQMVAAHKAQAKVKAKPAEKSPK
jgi:hypothetical protein